MNDNAQPDVPILDSTHLDQLFPGWKEQFNFEDLNERGTQTPGDSGGTEGHTSMPDAFGQRGGDYATTGVTI